MSSTVMLFSRSKTEVREQDDFYATPPEVTQLFLNNFKEVHRINNIWEPACGNGDMSKVLEDNLFSVRSSDLIDRGYGDIVDFLKESAPFNGSIMTNPPYKLGKEFLQKALDLIPNDQYVIFLLRIQFLESKTRRKLLESHLHSIYVHSERIGCAKQGDFSKPIVRGMTYCWFVFRKKN